jgi:mersacidin/lichenicidin family type 2 lantibiotic
MFIIYLSFCFSTKGEQARHTLTRERKGSIVSKEEIIHSQKHSEDGAGQQPEGKPFPQGEELPRSMGTIQEQPISDKAPVLSKEEIIRKQQPEGKLFPQGEGLPNVAEAQQTSDTVPALSTEEIIRSWKHNEDDAGQQPEGKSLSKDKKKQRGKTPLNPAGVQEISDEDLAAVEGGASELMSNTCTLLSC